MELNVISYNINACRQWKIDEMLKGRSEIAVVPECFGAGCIAVPKEYAFLWHGSDETEKAKGLGLFIKKGVCFEVPDWWNKALKYHIPVVLDLCGRKILFIAMWPTLKVPDSEGLDYYQIVNLILDSYQSIIRDMETVMTGDFNLLCNNPERRKTFQRLADLGLRNAYLESTGEELGKESVATYHHLFKKDRRYHIDFAFSNFPLEKFRIGAWNRNFSDHAPLTFSIKAEPSKKEMDTANDIEATIVSIADERQAAVLRRFFKTGAGEYGEGDKFLGVKNPQVRSVVKEAWKSTPVEEAVKLARSPWHEVRLCGLLILVAQFEKAAKGRKDGKTGKTHEAKMRKIFDTYLSLHPFINNWDLVDLSAYKIAGRYELLHPETTILDEWIKPEYTLWQRRISMVSTWIHIRHSQFGKALARAEMLLKSDHDLLHKAAGWMLREVWKHGGRDEVEDFLETHVAQMPSVMLSYTTELMPVQQREYWRMTRKNGRA